MHKHYRSFLVIYLHNVSSTTKIQKIPTDHEPTIKTFCDLSLRLRDQALFYIVLQTDYAFDNL